MKIDNNSWLIYQIGAKYKRQTVSFHLMTLLYVIVENRKLAYSKTQLKRLAKQGGIKIEVGTGGITKRKSKI